MVENSNIFICGYYGMMPKLKIKRYKDYL